MFHGPLVYLMGPYAGHAPFTEPDIDHFLAQYTPGPTLGRALKEDFLREAALDIYPAMADGRADEWARRRLFEPLSWIAFLYRRLIDLARQRTPPPIICGVVERGGLREFAETIVLERVFRNLRKNQKAGYFNQMFGRTDLTTPKALLDRLGYTDTLLLAMLLQPGQYSEPWRISKYDGLHRGEIVLPGEGFPSPAIWSVLRPPGAIGFPAVQ